MSQIGETVARIVGDHLGLPGATLGPHTHIEEDLGADSLDRLELIMTIEERFGVKIPPEEGERIQRLGDITSCLERILANESRKELT